MGFFESTMPYAYIACGWVRIHFFVLLFPPVLLMCCVWHAADLCIKIMLHRQLAYIGYTWWPNQIENATFIFTLFHSRSGAYTVTRVGSLGDSRPNNKTENWKRRANKNQRYLPSVRYVISILWKCYVVDKFFLMWWIRRHQRAKHHITRNMCNFEIWLNA